MNNQDKKIKQQSKVIGWERINAGLRIMIIMILIAILFSITYYKFGYEDPDDSKLMSYLNGQNVNITCKQALYYYAENKLQIFNESQREENLQKFNITNWDVILKKALNSS